MGKTLGLIEVNGYALAIQTVDIMLKSANVEVVGLESTSGFGWFLIKVTGDVGSVNAAVEVGMNNAVVQKGLIAHKVIARVSDGVCLTPKICCSTPSKVEEKVVAVTEAVEMAKSVTSESAGHEKIVPEEVPSKSKEQTKKTLLTAESVDQKKPQTKNKAKKTGNKKGGKA